jgi:hypothetical protein
VRAALNTTHTSDPRQQLETIQAELSSRASIYHFAHTGVAMVASMIIAGAAGKLAWDTYKLPFIGASVAMIAVALWVYALVHYRRGKRHLGQELKRYEELQALRRTLKLDDPSALLPQQ